MINLSSEQLQELEQNARLQFSISECAIILGYDQNEFAKLFENKKSPALKAYERGRLLASAEIRKAVFTQAKNGSSPAQKQMITLIQEAGDVNKKEAQKTLVVFSDPAAAAEIYNKKMTEIAGLFAVIAKFIDKDNEQQARIAKVKKIDGNITLSNKEMNIYEEDLREVYSPQK